MATALLIGSGLSAPAAAQPAATGPGPGLFTIHPLDHPDLVLTVAPRSKAAICEQETGEPDQAIRLRPVRRVYNVLNQRTDEYLGYYRDGRAGWNDELAEWNMVPVDGFGDGVHMIRVVDLAVPPAVLTYLGGDGTAEAGVRVAVEPGDAAYTTQLWKIERTTGEHPFSGELETPAGW